jgi:hypothetical protein
MKMAIKPVQEVRRTKGYSVKSGVNIVAGQPVVKDPGDSTGKTIVLAAGITQAFGIALETNFPFEDPTRFYDDYARGGLVSTTLNGIWEIWDDGRGSPYDTAQTYVIGQALYVNSVGQVTNDDTLGSIIGYVDKVPTSVTDSLVVKLVI